MEISDKSVLKLVTSARCVMRFSDDLNALLCTNCKESILTSILCDLCDVLFDGSGEVLRFDQDFNEDSKTMKLLRSELGDEDVAKKFVELSKKNHRFRETPEGERV